MESFSYDIIYPSAPLSPYIKYYWILEVRDCMKIEERIIPEGSASLIFHKANTLYSPTFNTYQPQTLISGQSSGFSEVSTTNDLHMICVVFQPHGMKPFFKIPVHEFQNSILSPDDISNSSLKELEYKIQECTDNKTCLTLIEDYLLKQLYSASDYNYKRMMAVVKTINKEPLADTRALADVACLSYKQFGRIFTEYIGAKPKEFSRIVRFQRALFTLQHNRHIDLTQLALECGYYDQPHLIKEFKTFSGYTPVEYMKVCFPYSDYFSTL
jgi:Transcriptional regulator containing an amidase domain and an AraC-type DNA-binding HTH domain